MACKALDGQVAVPADQELNDLLERFVCVRVVQMWGVDLSRFQFDGSLTWAIFMMHEDGTIYGRYGSRSGLGKESAKEISLAGFKKTLRGTLALDAAYRKDRSVGKALAAKSGRREEWTTAENIPDLKGKGRFRKRFTGVRSRQHGCIHCHMIPTAEVASLRKAGKAIPDRKFWPYPMPNEIGLRMDTAEMATVRAVEGGSIAGKAGFEKGDRILRLEGQPILSTADIQWVLHNAADESALEAEVERRGGRVTLKVSLDAGWRRRIGEWRFINLGLQRQALDFACKPLSPPERFELRLDPKELALRIERNVRGSARGKVQRGDVIVGVDGRRDATNLGGFTAYVYRKKRPGETLELTLLRDGRERTVKIPIH